LWGVLGHPSWLAGSFIGLILYLILMGIVRLSFRPKFLARRSDNS
jgi:hypothetical protein